MPKAVFQNFCLVATLVSPSPSHGPRPSHDPSPNHGPRPNQATCQTPALAPTPAQTLTLTLTPGAGRELRPPDRGQAAAAHLPLLLLQQEPLVHGACLILTLALTLTLTLTLSLTLTQPLTLLTPNPPTP